MFPAALSHTSLPAQPPALSLQGQVAALRHLLHEKFPVVERRGSGVLRTGLESLDQAGGGLGQGVVTELIGSSSSGTLFLEIILRALVREQAFGALVQAGHSFNPQDADSTMLRHLLWVRCDQPLAAVKAVDLLLRDGNLRVLIFDLQLVPPRELRRIPASTWHRYQRLVEATGMVFLILTAQPMIEGARVRIAIRQRWTLQAMKQRRSRLIEQLSAQVFVRQEFAVLLEGASPAA